MFTWACEMSEKNEKKREGRKVGNETNEKERDGESERRQTGAS